MTHEEIQKAAKKKVEAKKAFYILTFIFGFVSIVLMGITIYINTTYDPPLGEYFWLMLPIPAFILTLGILYLAIFGIPGAKNSTDDWEARQMKAEMFRLYRQNGLSLPPEQELSDEDKLELKELERLKQKWEGSEDLV